MSVIIDEGEEFLPNRKRKVTNAVGVKNNEKGAVKLSSVRRREN